MYVTLNSYLRLKKVKFINTKPTSFFLSNYTILSGVLSSSTTQKLPKIRRKDLVKLL